MQATLNDLSTQHGSPSFIICQRLLQRCHDIVFGDQLLPSNAPYSGFSLQGYTRRRKIKHHAQPVFVGIGVLLAGAPAMPQLADIVGQVAIEQGRAEEQDAGPRNLNVDLDHAGFRSSSSTLVNEDLEHSESPSSGEEESLPTVKIVRSKSETRGGSLPSRRRTFAAQTVPALPLHLQTIHKSRQSLDPLGQLDSSEASLMPSHSSPSLASARTPLRSAALNRADLLLGKYNPESKMHLLRGHYYSSEVRSLHFISLCGFEIRKGSIFAQPREYL